MSKIRDKIKSLSVKMMAIVMAISSCVGIKKEQPHKNDKKNKIEQIRNINEYTMEDAYRLGRCRNLNSFIDDAYYITDTIILNRHNYNQRICAGVYMESNDKVYIKHFIPDTTDATPYETERILRYTKKWNDEICKRSVLVHEFKHRHTIKKGCLNKNLSVYDYARMCQHNEISSYLGNFLYERESYLLALNSKLCSKEDAMKLISPRFNKYKQALKDGTINPESANFTEQQKENEFIMSVVAEAWIANEQKVNAYITKKRLKQKFQKNKVFIEVRNPFLYKSCLDVCYTHIKDGKLVNFNFFYNIGNNTPIKDVEIQPQVEEFIKYEKQKRQLDKKDLSLYAQNKKTATR